MTLKYNTMTLTLTNPKIEAIKELYRDDMAWVQYGGSYTIASEFKPVEGFFFVDTQALGIPPKRMWNAFEPFDFDVVPKPEHGFCFIQSNGRFKELYPVIRWAIKAKCRILVWYTGLDKYDVLSFCKREAWMQYRVEKVQGKVTLICKKY